MPITQESSMKTITKTLLLLTLSLCSTQLFASSGILPKPEKIALHTYVWIGPLPGPDKQNQGYRMNLGFVVGNKGVAVIDTGYTPAMAREMIAHIRSITPLPILYAVNTNSQPHRFFGNGEFQKAGAKVIAHPVEKRRMQASAGQFASGIEAALELPKNSVALPALPDSTVSKYKKIDLGGVSLHIRHHGAAHTPAPLVVHVLEDNIVFAGDILYSGRLLSVLSESKVKDWIATYDTLKRYGKATFVPGHGKPAPLSGFDFSTRAYLALLHTHMTRSVAEGIDAQDAMANLDQSAYKDFANFEMLSGRNASWTYLQAEAAGFE